MRCRFFPSVLLLSLFSSLSPAEPLYLVAQRELPLRVPNYEVGGTDPAWAELTLTNGEFRSRRETEHIGVECHLIDTRYVKGPLRLETETIPAKAVFQMRPNLQFPGQFFLQQVKGPKPTGKLFGTKFSGGCARLAPRGQIIETRQLADLQVGFGSAFTVTTQAP